MHFTVGAKADEPRRCTGRRHAAHGLSSCRARAVVMPRTGCRHAAHGLSSCRQASRLSLPTGHGEAGRRFDEREPDDQGTAGGRTGAGIRRDRGGRGLLRLVHAAFAAQAGAVRPGVRAGRWCRRHLVLESLPGRALRQRERLLHVHRPHVRGDPRRVGLVGALRRPAGDPALPGIRHRQDGPAPGHPVRRAGGFRRLRRGAQSLGRPAGGRRRRLGPVPGHRGWP